MRGLRPARGAAIAVLAVLGLGVHVSLSGAEDGATAVSGMLDVVDPLASFDWATPVDDPEVAAAAANGATVTDETCTFGDRPTVERPQIFRLPIQTTGHLVVTPSGNVTLVCHAAADAKSFRRPLPTQAIIVEPIPCFLASGRRTTDAQLVVTPSLHVHLVCHFQAPS